ncbi:hypothetical protein V1523DRAFT_449600 [Lipomyces doorenjongii]
MQFRTTEEAQGTVEQYARTRGFAVVKHSRRSSPYRMKFLCKCNGHYRSTRGLPGSVGQVMEGKTRQREGRSGKLGCKWMVALRLARKQGYWEICATSLVHNHSMDTHNGLSFHDNRLKVSAPTQANVDNMLQAILRSPFRPLQKSEMIHRSLRITLLSSDIVNRSHSGHISKSSSVMKLLQELPERGYSYSLLGEANTVLGIFIVGRTVIPESRRMGQLLFVDATYKTNDRKLPLVNIVGVNSNGSTFRIALCYLARESELYYGWMWDMLSILHDFSHDNCS